MLHLIPSTKYVFHLNNLYFNKAGFVATFPSELGETITNGCDMFFARVTGDSCIFAMTYHTLSDWKAFYLGLPHWLLNSIAFWCYFYWVPSSREELNYISAKDTGNERYVCHIKSEWHQCRYSYICKTLLVKANKICFFFYTLKKIFHIGEYLYVGRVSWWWDQDF